MLVYVLLCCQFICEQNVPSLHQQTKNTRTHSFTTFSTFSVDVVTWLSEGKTVKAMSYVATNNIGGIVAAGIGMAVAKKFFG
jgi:fluoride ion exporter CrcB/FEX